MSAQRMVTVATYGEVYQADLARTALEEEGVAVQLHDRETVSMDWLISNTVGGIKVKVPEADAERALAILGAKLSDPASYLAQGLSEDELTRQALAEQPEEGFVETFPEARSLPEPEPGSPDMRDAEYREDYARRFHRAAVFSAAFGPLLFYAIYLGLNAVFAPGRLSSEGQKRILYGFLACCFSSTFWLVVGFFAVPVFGPLIPE